MRAAPAFFLLLAGCAGLGDDLKTAGAACPQTPSLTPYITCLNAAEESVWRKDEPADLAAFQDYAAGRLALARDLDGGRLTLPQYRQAADAARIKFSAALTGAATARQQQANAERNRDQVEGFTNMKAQGASGDMGVSDMSGNNMGM